MIKSTSSIPETEFARLQESVRRMTEIVEVELEKSSNVLALVLTWLFSVVGGLIGLVSLFGLARFLK